MERWNPNFFLKQGREKKYDEKYLQQLTVIGRKISANNVPVIFSLAHLAKLSNTLYADLHSVVARSNIDTPAYPYRNFPIRKRSGGVRWISVPIPPLMAVQTWIAHNILRDIKPHNSAHAYVAGLSSPIKTHAQKHCSADWILKIDVKNFFSNISEKHVYKVFEGLGYSKLLSFEMARLCTRITPKRRGRRWNLPQDNSDVEMYDCKHVGSLPQGAPTSPALSNLVCKHLDSQLETLAQQYGATYSRYADDLCFSFSKSSRNEVYGFKKKVNHFLWENGFTENNKKTRIIPPGGRKIVTGLVLNDSEPKIPREMRDRIRMHLYFAKKLGIAEHCERKNFRSVIGFRNHLTGLIIYVKSVNRDQGIAFENDFNQLPWLKYQI